MTSQQFELHYAVQARFADAKSDVREADYGFKDIVGVRDAQGNRVAVGGKRGLHPKAIADALWSAYEAKMTQAVRRVTDGAH